MSISTLRRGAVGSFVAVLLLGVLATVLAARPAQARVATLSFAFEQLMPGESREDSDTFAVPRTARISEVQLEEDSSEPGAFTWELSLCPASGACLPVARESEGREVPAGEARLEVSVRLDEDAPQLASSSVSGRIVFSADDDESGELPPTGAASLGILAGALALLGVGIALLLVARRRSRPPSEDGGSR